MGHANLCRGPELNWRHMVLQTIALPTELPRRSPILRGSPDAHETPMDSCGPGDSTPNVVRGGAVKKRADIALRNQWLLGRVDSNLQLPPAKAPGPHQTPS